MSRDICIHISYRVIHTHREYQTKYMLRNMLYASVRYEVGLGVGNRAFWLGAHDIPEEPWRCEDWNVEAHAFQEGTVV